MKLPAKSKKTVLFVCVENAGRSQMAEGFFNSRYAPSGYQAVSAGTKPAGHINQVAVEAMTEVGIDISKQRSKIVTDDMIRGSVRAINMGCMDKAECPILFLNNPIDWSIEDPKGKSIERVRSIRNEIEKRVKDLAANLE